MARRRSSKNDDGMGCLFAIFELIGAILLLLFTSGDPTARKIGWGIIGILVLFGMLTSSGASGEEALGIIVVLAVLVIIVIVIIAFISDSKNKKSTSQTNS